MTTAGRSECAWQLPTPRKSKLSSSKIKFLTKKVCFRYGQRAGRSGKIARRMRLRSAKVFSRWTQPATGTWARLHILSELILTPGRTSFYFLNQPGQADIQTDLFFDYQNNLKAYPIWQKWLCDHTPPMLVLWGRYD